MIMIFLTDWYQSGFMTCLKFLEYLQDRTGYVRQSYRFRVHASTKTDEELQVWHWLAPVVSALDFCYSLSLPVTVADFVSLSLSQRFINLFST